MKRWFCIALVLALCCTSTPLDWSRALAEGGEAAWIDALDESPAEGAAEDRVEAAEPLESVEEISEFVLSMGDDPEPETYVELAAAGTEASAYAEAAEGGLDVFDDEGRIIATVFGGEPVLAVGEAADGGAYIAFLTERGLVEGSVRRGGLIALDPEACEALMDDLAFSGEAVPYRGDLDRLLPFAACTFAAVPGGDEDLEVDSPSVDEADMTDEAAVPATEEPEATDEASAPAAEDAEGAADETGIEAASDGEAAFDSEPADAALSAAPRPAAQTIRLNVTSVSIGVRETYGLLTAFDGNGNPLAVTWESPSAAIRVLDSASGEIYGVRAGTATLYARAGGYEDAAVAVTVLPAPSKIRLNQTSVELNAGKTVTLSAEVVGDGTAAGAIAYTSSDPSVAAVGRYTGVVTGVSKGMATITAESYNGLTADCQVTVYGAADRIALDSETINVYKGQKLKLPARIVDADGVATLGGIAAAIDPDHSDASCLTLDAEALKVKGVSDGSAVIVLSAEGCADVRCTVNVVAPPARIALSRKTLTLGVGEACREVTVVLTPTEGYAGAAATITFSSSNAKVAKVSKIDDTRCKITGVKAGTATITATSQNGKRAALTVTVKAAPTSLGVSPNAAGLIVGETAKLTPKPAGGTASFSYTYASDDESVARVDENGVVTAVGKGTATVTVRAFNKKAGKCVVTVYGVPSRVALDRTQAAISAGQTIALAATLLDADGHATLGGASIEIDPASPNADCVELDPAGFSVTGLSEGRAVIRAFYEGCTDARCTVDVVNGPDSVVLSENAIVIGVGEVWEGVSASLDPAGTAASISWKSDKTSVAKVKSTGEATCRITGVKAGMTTVRAIAHNGPEAPLSVHVLSAPKSIGVQPAAAALIVGETLALTANPNSGAACSHYTYESSATDVATVDGSGTIAAVGKGAAVITVKSYNGRSKTCRVMVYGAPDHIEIAGGGVKLHVGKTVSLPASVKDSDGDDTIADLAATLAAPEDADRVALDAAAMTVEGLAIGQASVRLSAEGCADVACPVSVVQDPQALALNVDALAIGVGERCDHVTVALDPVESDATITWSSDKPAVAKVKKIDDAHCRITGVKAGKATITATAQNGATASVTVNVKKAPAKLTVKPASVALIAGETLPLTVTADSGALTHPFAYASSDESVATVDADGVVTAVGKGAATITATAYNGVYARRKVTVYGVPDHIALAETGHILYVGQKIAIPATAMDADGDATLAPCTAAIDGGDNDEGCVIVSAQSLEVTGVTQGRATVTLSVDGYACAPATYEVEVVNGPARLTLNDTDASAMKLTIGVGETFKGIYVNLIPEDGEAVAAGKVKWTSGNAKFATVSASGETGCAIRGVKAGKATITATCNGQKATVTVTVKNAPKSISVKPSSMKLSPGMRAGITPAANAGAASGLYRYSSNNPSVASVDASGMVTAVAPGAAKITVKSYNGKTATVKVTVNKEPDQVFITESLMLAEGMSGSVAASALDEDGAETQAAYTYYAVDGTGSVSVEAETGRVTALTAGTAYVGVRAQNGVDGHVDAGGIWVDSLCVVTVEEAPARVELSVTSKKIYVDETVELRPVLYTRSNRVCQSGTYTVTVTSGDSVTVDQSGVVTGKRAGVSVVRVESYNGKHADCTVTVLRRYRMFMAYGYYDTGDVGDLFFTKKNAKVMQKAFQDSRIRGMTYDTVGFLRNPTRAQLLNGIENGFSGGKSSDINLIYLCTHGYNRIDGKSMHYGLQIPGYKKSDPNTYVAAPDLFEKVKAIQGKVILILDSCYSGVFITQMRAKLDAQKGRISVLTAANNSTACYWNVRNKTNCAEFFTYYMLYGLGYDYKDQAEGTYRTLSSHPADKNKDGKITVNEMFGYAKSMVTSNVPKYRKNKLLHGYYKQSPQIYAGNNGGLVIFQYR